MFVVSYSDFFSNPTLYKEKAENYGLKILPQKKEKKYSRRVQKKMAALNAVIGILPSDIDEEAIINSKDLKFAFTGVMSDFEDALQAYCAKRYHIDYIITRNSKDFQLSPVKAIEPVDFINKI